MPPQASESLKGEARGTNGYKIDKDSVNFVNIFGTTPGNNVAAKSSLALEFTQHLINKSMNLRSECIVPDDFTDFRACNTQSEVVSNTSKYSISFG